MVEEDLTMTESDSEKEDDEMMMLVFLALYLASTKTKTPFHTSNLSGAEYTRELLEGHRSGCFTNLQMEARIFQGISDYLCSKNLLRSTRGVIVEEQLAMFMYMLARNASFSALCDRFQHSREIIHRHIGACFDAITSMTFDFVKPPSAETRVAEGPKAVMLQQIFDLNGW